jgi:hypothetical protein
VGLFSNPGACSFTSKVGVPSVHICQNTRPHIPEDSILHSYCYENLTFLNVQSIRYVSVMNQTLSQIVKENRDYFDGIFGFSVCFPADSMSTSTPTNVDKPRSYLKNKVLTLVRMGRRQLLR